VERGTQKRRKDKKRLWKCPDCNSGISDRGLRQQLRGNKGLKDPGSRLASISDEGKKTTTNGIGGWRSGQQLQLQSEGMLKKALYEIVSVKMAKQIAGSYIALRRTKDWTLWRG
jgi:hypothetical protein